MSNMSRGRKDPTAFLTGPRKKKVAPKKQTVLDNAKAAAESGFRIPTTKEVPAGKMTNEIGRRASKDAAAKVAARDAKAATRRKKAGALAKAGKDMSEGLAADRARFSQEHDQAVERGAASHARMRQSTPGKAQGIIKKRRI